MTASSPTIIQSPAKVLRLKAEEVPPSEIRSKRIRGVIERMKKALESQDDGVAIAAPQIGEALRIFVVSGKIISAVKDRGEKARSVADTEHLVFINPRITKLSKKKQDMEEGCLSLRWLYGEVKRADKATVEALDENGNRFTRGASGIMAQIYQHEMDHLDGTLFVDKAKNVRDLPPAEGRSV